MIMETERLYLRELCESDYGSLCQILQDEDVMYAYGHAFECEEVHQWLNRQLDRYQQYGFGLWAVILKENQEMIGQCGLTMQDIGNEQVLEVGYLFRKDFWHNGYAIESAKACKEYAFEMLGADKVYSIIRDNNVLSQKVAVRNGMIEVGEMVKHYNGIDMPHIIYCVEKEGRS